MSLEAEPGWEVTGRAARRVCNIVTLSTGGATSGQEAPVSTQPVRIPEDDLRSARSIAGLLGTTPGNLLHEAFQEYLANHREEINDTFRAAKKHLATGDREGLMGLASRGIHQRAQQAAAEAASPATVTSRGSNSRSAHRA